MEKSMRVSVIVLVFLIIATSSTTISFCNGDLGVLCKENERHALLRLKQDLNDAMNPLSNWVGEEGDCCSWTGVVCNNITGHVLELHLSYQIGKINPSLLNLTHLSYLDLGSNYFGGTKIPSFIGSLKNLKFLDLSNAGFAGIVPHQLGNLTSLRHLNLYEYNYPLMVENLQWISGLSSLQYLNMGGVNLSKAFDWLQQINSLSSLQALQLFHCDLDDHIAPLTLPAANLTSLANLDLSHNHLQGNIGSFIENLTSIVRLVLSHNRFEGQNILNSLRNLCKLQELKLSDNNLNTEVSEAFKSLSGCMVNSLGRLGLERNHLSGQLPGSLIGNFSNLVTLFLTSNSISGPIPESLGKLSHLRSLGLSSNRLSGSLPESIGQLAELESLYIPFNLLEGQVSEIHFVNMTSLQYLCASGNSLTLKTGPNWLPPFQLYSLRLNSWNLGPELPRWIQRQSLLSDLRISNTSISSPLPAWFKIFSSQLDYLNLSHNQLKGEFPVMISRFTVVDLTSNQFSGSLPPVRSSNVNILDLSNNSFSGSIFNLLCHLNDGPYVPQRSSNKSIICLKNNLLSGEIPNCWTNWQHLMVLHLDNNNFAGVVPSSMGLLSNLRSLHLDNNSLSGELPFSLSSCPLLLNVDLSGNKFGGNIPLWFGTSASNLVVLNLGSNNFHGDIPPELCNLANLRILVLSHNNLSGIIPRCFYNLTAMAVLQNISDPTSAVIASGEWQFLENALLITKGRENEYSTLLKLVTSVDLSNNSLSGTIPEELTSLVLLQTLNLSMNNFTGQIPPKIGDMRMLESLDLSRNQLSGQLPPSLSSLSFLSALNLSYNNLTGGIPTGTQLQSLDQSSFIGNQLCGPPLVKACSVIAAMPPEFEVEDREGDLLEESSFQISLGIGFMFGLWIVLGSLLLNVPWRIACCRLLDSIVLRLCGIVLRYSSLVLAIIFSCT